MQPPSILWLTFLFLSIAFVVTAYPAAALASPAAAEENKESPTTNDESQEQDEEAPPPPVEEEPQQQPPEEPAPPTETTEEPKPVEPTTEASLPVTEEEEGPDNDCLFNPSLPKCASDNGECPDGFFQNEDGNCVPSHPNGCPEGYHSHEDDETGQCIPNDVPCEPGYILILEGKPSCLKKEFACNEFPDANGCKNNDNDDDDNDDDNNDNGHNNKIIKIIKNVKIVNEINNANDDLDIDRTIVAINYQEGKGINCIFDDDDNGECETFDVTKDSNKEPLLQVIPFS